MGLFKNLKRVFSDVGAGIKVAAPILAPIALGAGGFFAAKFLAPRIGALFADQGGGGGGLAGLLGGGGSQAVVASNFATAGGCPAPGFQGNRSPFANPIFRNATSVGFNTATIPARPQVAQNALLEAIGRLFAGPTQQTTSFNQGAFGATVAPSFRPFAPSFRSGQQGFSGPFMPGISQGLAPRSIGFEGSLPGPDPRLTSSLLRRFSAPAPAPEVSPLQRALAAPGFTFRGF